MKKTYSYIIALITALTQTACGDFLEPQSKSEYRPEDITALNELILGNAIPTVNISTTSITTPLLILDDDVTTRPYIAPKTGNPSDYQQSNFMGLKELYSWQPYHSKSMTDYKVNRYDLYDALYAYIAGSNIALDYIDRVTGSQEEKDYVKAQALTLRSYYYLQLVNIYALPYNKDKKSLGVPLKLTGAVEDRQIVRNTVEEVYAQIEKDLLEAERLFSELPAQKQWRKDYRPSLPMAQLILARTYLFMENWTEAAKYADKVINDWSFSLFNLSSYPLPDRTYFPDMATYDSSESIWVFGECNGSFYYAAQSFYSNGSRTLFEASESLINCYQEGDLRKSKYIVSIDERAEGRKAYRAYGKIPVTVGTANPKPLSTKNAHALRISEAYLIYAESNAKLAQAGIATAASQAIEALNALRIKRFEAAMYQPLPDMSNEEIIAFIQEERRRELCFEAFRWFDLKRYGMPKIEHIWITGEETKEIYTLASEDNFYALPLPHKALEQNSSLVQNPLPPTRLPN